MKYLLDTCVISELVKKSRSETVVTWVNTCEEHALFLSALTIGEVQKGIARLPEGERRRTLQHWLDVDLRSRFAGRILAVTEEVAATWGALLGEATTRGVAVPVIDGLIGATAVAHDLTVATRNVGDIGAIGARTMNPWLTGSS